MAGVVADLIAVAGLIVMLWARKTLGANWSSEVVLKQNHELIERGPYAYVRHPIYTGVILMALGTMILFARLSGFVAWVIFVFGFWLKAREEERLLAKHFPEAYPTYKARVKAVIPFVL